MNRPPVRALLLFSCLIALIAADGAALAQDICDGVSPVDNTSLKSVAIASVAPGRPLLVTAPPEDPNRIFIVDQNGRILVKPRGQSPTVFLNLTTVVSTFGNEMGLLGLAFHPDYATNGLFYVSYTERPVSAITSVIARYQASPPSSNVSGTTETRILEFGQPQTNHNGGHIEFGSDGLLYMGSGDGGGGSDLHGTCGNGQDTTNLLGAILRIDVDQTTQHAADCGEGVSLYTIPEGNELRDGAGGDCDEIWSWGLRNPWRFSFDPANDDLYIGDVGQECTEELDWVAGAEAGGENFGWRPMEGHHCFDPGNRFDCSPDGVSCLGSPDCDDPSLTDPFVTYEQSAGGCAVTGGYVYRGCRMPNFSGTYFYGDYCAGFVRSVQVGAGGRPINGMDWTTELAPGNSLAGGLTSFGTDAQGELYIADRDGIVLKVMPPFPDLAVSGIGATFFQPERDADWTWEDLEFNTMHPVDNYRVYRGQPGGSFDCIHTSATPSWPAGGDGSLPTSGNLLAYLVTAIHQTEETSSGEPTRTLTDNCP